MPKKKLYHWIVDALHDAKAKDIVVLDVRKISDFTDYMVIASGTSTRHVQSGADKVIEKLRSHGHRQLGIEGMETGEWVLIDFGEAVAHLMRPPTRDFYNLEKLWSEGKEVKLTEKKTHRQAAKAAKD